MDAAAATAAAAAYEVLIFVSAGGAEAFGGQVEIESWLMASWEGFTITHNNTA